MRTSDRYFAGLGCSWAIAFNFNNLESVSDNQAVFMILDWVGITRTSQRARREGTVVRRYFVDIDNLAMLKTVIQRRIQGDPFPHIIDHREGDGSGTTVFAGLSDDLRALWETATTAEERDAILRAGRSAGRAIAIRGLQGR